jgi:ketopantoate reductase
LELGRASELDYLQGEIVQRAERLGLQVPANRAVMVAVEAAFAQKTSPRMSGASMAQSFLE